MASLRKTVDRRSFLKLGAAASGVMVGGCGPPGGSEAQPIAVELGYRPLGGTGLKVSEVAFGAHGLDRPDLMRAALDAGINTFCVSGQYLDGMEEEALGEAMSALGGRREEVVILTGNVVRRGTSKQKVLDEIDASLKRLRTDHIDVYLTGEVRAPDDLRVDALYEAFDVSKRAGKVGHLGLSSHAGGMQACLNAAIDNAHNRQGEIKDLEAGGLSFPQATVKWALTNSYVASVAVSMSNFDTIRQYSAAAGTTLTTAEVSMLRRYADEMYDTYCRFCAECEASCPHGVAVADINRYAMYFSGYGREKEAMRRYQALSKKYSAQSCDGCSGPCDAACPFGRRVRAELLEAHRQLSFREA
jgi:aryl-alcohol dehydrogenase-like predicted oxidoreductase